MSGERWNGEPADVIGDAEPAEDQPDEPEAAEQAPCDNLGEEFQRQRGETIARGLTVATVALACAVVLRIALSVWGTWRGMVAATPVLRGWKWTVIFAGGRASDIQLLVVVTVLAAAATVGITWLNGRESRAGGSRAWGWGRAAAAPACAASVAGIVLGFYLLALVLRFSPQRPALLVLAAPSWVLAQVALVALACAVAGILLSRYAVTQRSLASPRPPTPE